VTYRKNESSIVQKFLSDNSKHSSFLFVIRPHHDSNIKL